MAVYENTLTKGLSTKIFFKKNFHKKKSKKNNLIKSDQI